jgi:hypothetical protein
MGTGTSQGLKWIGLLVLYFFLMTIIVSAVSMMMAGVSTGLNISSTSMAICSEPRLLYYPDGSSISSYDDNLSTAEKNSLLRNLECSESIGVTSSSTCTNITGCSWGAAGSCAWWEFWCDPGALPTTCIGDINGTAYNITETSTSLFGRKHIAGGLFSSPNVCTDYGLAQTECEELSCTWNTEYYQGQIDVEKISPSPSMITYMWDTISGMFTFTYDFGIDNTFATYIITFLIFYLPLILLVGAIVGVIRG